MELSFYLHSGMVLCCGYGQGPPCLALSWFFFLSLQTLSLGVEALQSTLRGLRMVHWGLWFCALSWVSQGTEQWWTDQVASYPRSHRVGSGLGAGEAGCMSLAFHRLPYCMPQYLLFSRNPTQLYLESCLGSSWSLFILPLHSQRPPNSTG